MRKVVISGGPHAGKTTLLEALRFEYPDAHFVSEPAERVITREQARHAQNPCYAPRLPWVNYRRFGPAVVRESVALEASIPLDAGLVFMDRCLIDTIAYSRLNRLPEFIPDVERRVQVAGYSLALLCEPVGDYTQTTVRRESADEAREIHDCLAEAYDQSGLTVVTLPAVSVVERVDLVRAAIG